MSGKITAEQLQELEDARWIDLYEYHKLLEEYTGIVAEQYRAYSYYDIAGNYLGDSSYCGVMDLLESAYIEVEQEG